MAFDASSGSYKFNIQKKIALSCGETIAMWSFIDSLVIKVLAGILQDKLKPYLFESCYHLKGHGGLKGAVWDVMDKLPEYRFFCKTDVKYFRSMDDILISAPTRWKLRKAIRVMNQTFDELKLEQHPDKTLIGRTERGFDFLGYYFRPDGLSIAGKTVERFMERMTRLYEQGADSLRIGQYVSKWIEWVNAGLLGAGKMCRAALSSLLYPSLKILMRERQWQN
jgi:hypothetical protein